MVMKKISWISCLAAAAGLLSLTGCFKNNASDDTLKPEEIQAAFQAVKGEYEGRVIYNTAGDYMPRRLDTALVNWRIDSDSTLLIRDFPASFLGTHANDKQLAKALKEQGKVDIGCRIGFMKTSPVMFLINPFTSAFDLVYNGEAHKVEVVFYVNNYYSYGIFDPAKKVFQMQIVQAGFYVDGKLRGDLLPSGIIFYFETKKE